MQPVLETLGNGFDRNLCYVLGCRETGEGALVDAGIRTDRVPEVFEARGLSPRVLLVTHGHGDHLSEGTDFVRRTGAEVHAFEPSVAARIGARRFHPLTDGAVVQLGRLRLEALHTPGHSPDSGCFLCAEAGLVFTGDTLFVGRTGRTLGPGASTRELFRSVERLRRLPPETLVLPGHDYGPSPTTTIGREIETNAFLRAGSEEEFVKVMEDFERERRRS
jgi:glyoxylase-like metal-dependent hydrolase (beta-lactamase superfamily II)